jgi:mRNA interferase MazF
MALKYVVSPKTILLCDYSMGGFRPPEMQKRRPAVVLVGRLPRRDNLVTVVPLSGTESDPRNLYHCRIELSSPLPEPFAETVWWAKCDMVATVGLVRCDLFQTARDQFGRRKYLTDMKVSGADFDKIQTAVKHGLGLA